ncbi:transposase domain-containing protein [Alicyclobacillus sp. SO9]|uniref:transposase domain-containing protein n=1 Tax=Alicyclobacillus sp. SO9 TaxID=2665646 RepID=UPI0018E74067|nr:transposase domain-containing protein [Alicyclobacillus sp. SO9]
METAKENGLNLFVYLEYLCEQLPNLDESFTDTVSHLLLWSNDLREQVRNCR